MKHLIVTLFAAVAIGAQEPARHDKYKDDPHAYCWNPSPSGSQAPRRARDPHAHQCACHLICRRDGDIGPNGDTDYEDQTCELYCTRSRCTCHTEEPCEQRH